MEIWKILNGRQENAAQMIINNNRTCVRNECTYAA